MKFKIAKDGLPIIVFFVLLTIFSAFFHIYISVIFFVLLSFCVFFLRDPEREITKGENIVLAPADGKVMVIEQIQDSKISDEPVHRISIFLSIFDVHINRAPVDGEIVYLEYSRGRFLDARNPKASEVNENNFMVLSHKGAKVALRQIAGKIARRVVCKCSKGDKLKIGERIGMIRFGSRTDLFLPMNAEINIKIGDMVKAGITIVGKLP
ncbi:phosphatidylserine decarboxylase family protein [bacterium]|nr:phosphatidylserine decarboxylase family protein [bacterium]